MKIINKNHPFTKLHYVSHGKSFQIGEAVTNYIEIGCGLETINLEITQGSFKKFNDWLMDLHKDYTKEKKISTGPRALVQRATNMAVSS